MADSVEVSYTPEATAAITVVCEFKPNGYVYSTSDLYDEWKHCAQEWVGEGAKVGSAKYKEKVEAKGYNGSLYFVQEKPVSGDKAQLIFMHLFENEEKAHDYLKDDEFRDMVADLRKTFKRVTNQTLVYQSGHSPGG